MYRWLLKYLPKRPAVTLDELNTKVQMLAGKVQTLAANEATLKVQVTTLQAQVAAFQGEQAKVDTVGDVVAQIDAAVTAALA